MFGTLRVVDVLKLNKRVVSAFYPLPTATATVN